jgi:hypothetical protein
MRLLQLVAAALAAALALASACDSSSFPYSMAGIEVWGLTNAPAGAGNATACAEACCAMAGCTVWQLCPGDGSACGIASCWIGTVSGHTTGKVAGWVVRDGWFVCEGARGAGGAQWGCRGVCGGVPGCLWLK